VTIPFEQLLAIPDFQTGIHQPDLNACPLNDPVEAFADLEQAEAVHAADRADLVIPFIVFETAQITALLFEHDGQV